MRIALMADVHGNLEALQACLAHAAAQRAERLVFLGDLVGYGADPEAVVEIVAGRVGKGARAILGNHDEAIARGGARMNAEAATAIAWTRNMLGAEARRFLAGLPLAIEEDGRLYVHAEASAPHRWHYVRDGETARHSIAATAAQATFCGHVHVPAIYGLSSTDKLASLRPTPGVAVPLLRSRRWLVVLGAVGQPRDRNPAAAYATLDAVSGELTTHRVPYDVERAAAKIRAAGLPPRLAARLLAGE